LFKDVISMEFSKKIVLAMLITWIASLVVTIVLKIFNIDTEFILTYTQVALVSGVIGYLTKSGIENVNKINEWGNPDDKG